MRPVQTVPEMGGGRIKENDGGSDDVIVRTFVNVTMYPQHNKKVDIIHLTHRRKKKENKRNSPSLVSA
jgi:hypothetical protein